MIGQIKDKVVYVSRTFLPIWGIEKKLKKEGEERGEKNSAKKRLRKHQDQSALVSYHFDL